MDGLNYYDLVFFLLISYSSNFTGLLRTDSISRSSPNPGAFFLKFFVYSLLVVLISRVLKCLWFGLFVAAAALPPRFFVGHSIYKGKAALTVEPRPPEFTPLDVCLT